jgi:pyrroloquinoline quinone biosynthesis protein B
MLVRVLGSAAGGGVPQWNCGCQFCIAAARDPALARTCCSVAVSPDGATWTVLNAAAELPAQLSRFPALRPRGGARQTPFAQLMLSDAELDHTLGLLMLRQAAYADVDQVPADAVVGLQVSDPRGGSLIYAPCVPILNDALLDACRACSLVLLDGTFFSDDELANSSRPRSARQLGHLPVSGPVAADGAEYEL